MGVFAKIFKQKEIAIDNVTYEKLLLCCKVGFALSQTAHKFYFSLTADKHSIHLYLKLKECSVISPFKKHSPTTAAASAASGCPIDILKKFGSIVSIKIENADDITETLIVTASFSIPKNTSDLYFQKLTGDISKLYSDSIEIITKDKGLTFDLKNKYVRIPYR